MSSSRNKVDEILFMLRCEVKKQSYRIVAERAGIGRESLYKSLKPRSNASFYSIFNLCESMGLKISISR